MPIGFAPTPVAVDLDTLRSEASSDGWWESSEVVAGAGEVLAEPTDFFHSVVLAGTRMCWR
jgi:hypothetical protein